MGITSCYAITTESNELDNDTFVFSFPASGDAIRELRWSCLSLINVIIFDEDLSFVIMKEAGYYFVLSGNNGFVERLVYNISAARSKFDEYANSTQFPQTTRTFLISVADRYRGFNG